MNTRLRSALAGMAYAPFAALRGIYAWLMRPYFEVGDLYRMGRLREYLTGTRKVACDEWEAGDAPRPFPKGAGR